MNNKNGVPIVDATESLIWKTNRPDVNKAIALDPTRCVIAQGAKRVMKGAVIGAKIGAKMAYVHYGDHIKRYIISSESQAMVKAYDKAGFYPTGVPVTLLVPPKSLQLGTRRNPGPKTPPTGKTNLRSPKKPWLRHIGQTDEW